MKDENPFFVSKRNKRGIFLFVIIVLLIIFTPRFLLLFQAKEEFIVSKTEIIEFQENAKKVRQQKESKKSFKKKKRYFKPKSKFDPNLYSEKEWITLGLSEKQAAVVLKFTKRGVYSNEQLEKIFVIPSELYVLIKDSTIYPKKENNVEYAKKEAKEIILIEINGSDQSELETIPGVGSFYAKSILNYREKLGGFHYREQLLEVWKMDIEKYNAIEKYIKIDPTKIRKMELNTISVEGLKEHPYLNWNIANSIIKIRNQKGNFKSINEIKESVLIDIELFEKLKPYLSL